ncbi:outer membrane lipoprotein chaperone LolA [Candidatus Pantoea carbekii]|uniref:Outer-membrane lipoprotein carrier protein n=1 Tax=Candidatus Pantoea carbekii TaxID=1235990 RepID=U3U9S6_9GAMM|nr:outer membrane lipoprotein chaperone LolA [Candidatus Pantoea carbekii]AKC32166.1 outer-membrane lipoprotein carrier protein precursor LolA [Candidatus Pantoea carbekii]BAO00693.1 hypothetical protein HHS_07230 [Candidatus Pantoea carbekii]
MKLLIIICSFLIGCSSKIALADASNNLQYRLNQVNSFHVFFSQTVTDTNGVNIHNGKGELWVKHPNLFNWHIQLPDENFIISDGKNLWFYNPYISQVSVNFLQNMIDNTPFILFTRNKKSDWKNYTIKQQGDQFEVIPKANDTNLKKFTITVTSLGIIRKFSTIEQDGQCNSYQFDNQNNGEINSDKFIIKFPKWVTVDDQREYNSDHFSE